MRKVQLSTSTPHRQHGAIAVMAAVMMTTLLMFLAVVVDTGRLYLEKRSLQKNADLAAMETALRYCRDQGMRLDYNIHGGDSLRTALDAVLTRNDAFVTERFINPVFDSDGTVTNELEIANNKVTTYITKTVPSSIFGRILNPQNDDITLSAKATAKACEPTARLEIRTSLLGLNTSESVLDGVINSVLGTNLNLDAVGWQGIAQTSINLLDFLEVAVDLGFLDADAGNFSSALTGALKIGDIATVLTDNRLLGAVTGPLDTLLSEILPSNEEFALSDLLKIATGTSDEALNVGISVLDLVYGSVQVVAKNNGAVIDLPVPAVGLTAKVVLSEPPQISPTGNPEIDEIYVKSAQGIIYLSFELSDSIFGSLLDIANSLTSSPLVNEVIDFVNGLFYLEIVGSIVDLLDGLLGVVFGGSQETVLYTEVLSNPTIDIAILTGVGEARVIDYDCSIGNKSLQVEANSGLAQIKIGSFGIDFTDPLAIPKTAEDFDSITPNAVPLLDLGTVEAKKCSVLNLPCVLSGGYEYLTNSGTWSTNKNDAERNQYAAGGVSISFDNTVPNNDPSATTFDYIGGGNPDYLPNVDQTIPEEVFSDPSYQISESNLITGLSNTLEGLNINFHEPSDDNSIGGILNIVGTTLNGLLEGTLPVILNILSTVLDPIVESVLSALGLELANSEIGAAMTCENDRVRLTH